MIEARARLYQLVREFFLERRVLEVIPPVLAPHSVSDPHISSFPVLVDGETQYLQTSPEFALKKLLAKVPEPLYSLGPVFRRGEQGVRHQHEFIMLEWYRPGFDLTALENEIADLIAMLAEQFDADFQSPERFSYEQLFSSKFGMNPHLASDTELENLVRKHFPDFTGHLGAASRNDYLDTLFSLGVEPELTQPTFVREFPASQASLANLSSLEPPTALRSELYWQGLELSNAYDELKDSDTLRQRITSDNETRVSLGLPQMTADEDLLQAIEKMPPCAGVAIGIDRLLMLLMSANDLSEVSPFA
jgi:lysyl-tRNA synthetase class 2